MVEASGSVALVQNTDITDENQCRELITKAIARYDSLDYLVLCAGLSMWSRFEDVTDLSVFKSLLEVN